MLGLKNLQNFSHRIVVWGVYITCYKYQGCNFNIHEGDTILLGVVKIGLLKN